MNQKTHDVFILNEESYNIPEDLKCLVYSILSTEDVVDEKIVSVSFINEREMVNLHKEYIGYAQPTDVLSFEANELDPESGKEFLGDILICYPYVVRQSLTLGNNLFSEIKLMVIHGMLHLLGYAHDTEEGKLAMWHRQSLLLTKNSIDINQLPE